MKYKYDIFICYSRKDRNIVKSLVEILRTKGFNIWLDEWEIQVGEQIIEKISEGLDSSRYLAIWLSENSANSSWVQKEWQTKFWDENDSDLTIILPLLGEKSPIPPFLKGRKYANFSRSFDTGLAELLSLIENNCSVVIDSSINNLIQGIDADVCAAKLGQISIRARDENAFLGLWEAALKTKKPYSVIDHIVYSFSRVVIESEDKIFQELGFGILKDSAKHESEIIVDKFAYAAGDIALESEDQVFRKQVIDFIKLNYEGNVPIPKERYLITKRRLEEVDSEIFN